MFFMINILMENVCKYMQLGGNVFVYVQEMEFYVEILVKDDGLGFLQEDVECILSEKVYDLGKIGLQISENVSELQKNKGYGFGLMNCKGIIDKYKKINEIFWVCLFWIESELGKGSCFYFCLFKGVCKMLMLVLVVFFFVLVGCNEGREKDGKVEQFIVNDFIQ